MCVSNNDLAHCGNACTPCPTDPNGVASCNGAACAVACNAGYTTMGAGCVDVNECALTSGLCGHGSCTNRPGTYTCNCDPGYAAPATGGTCTSTAIGFPSASSTQTYASPPYYWNAGDNVRQTVTLSLPSVSRAQLHLVFTNNFLNGDTDDSALFINGTQVGTFRIPGPGLTFDVTLSFAPVTGPTYNLEIRCTRTVISGDGSVRFDTSNSTISLN
jgi:hypothetical protein